MANISSKIVETSVAAIFRSLTGAGDEGDGKPISILMTGKTGVGKSSLVNAIVGANVAKEGKDLSGVTRDVIEFETEINDIKFKIWDSPGLQDITESDTTITDRIKSTLMKNCSHLHLVCYCIRMDRDRIERSEMEAIKQLTDVFKSKIWETTVFVLTFANRVVPPPEQDTDELAPKWFKKRINEFQDQITTALIATGMDAEKATTVPIIPAGYHRKTRAVPNPRQLPDRPDWFNPFWYTCANTMSENAVIALFASQKHRIRFARKSKGPLDLKQQEKEIEVARKCNMQELKEKLGQESTGELSHEWKIEVEKSSPLYKKFKGLCGTAYKAFKSLFKTETF